MLAAAPDKAKQKPMEKSLEAFKKGAAALCFLYNVCAEGRQRDTVNNPGGIFVLQTTRRRPARRGRCRPR